VRTVMGSADRPVIGSVKRAVHFNGTIPILFAEFFE
jgi:hypothetical protein